LKKKIQLEKEIGVRLSWQATTNGSIASLVIKDIAYEPKAKNITKFSRPRPHKYQGQLQAVTIMS